MKKQFNYYLSLAVGASALFFTACTPEDHDMPAASVTSAELVEGIAFSVTPDANDPNTIHLKSLVKGAQPCWETPSGLSQSPEITLELPFSGEYTVKFGVTTGAGLVWGEPYTFTVSQNNFEMLSDEIWTNLAGGVDENGKGNPKVWVPMDKSYPPYQGSAPVAYMSPDDVMNDGSGKTELLIGTSNWKPNWDPGFQSWLIPADDPYMGSEMTLSLDAQKGCIAEIKRVDSNGTTTTTGSFNLNVSTRTQPTLSFTGCEMLHAAWGDGVCDNYFKDIKILECTPYVLQFATMRTNSEGPWWIIWNFVAKDVRDGLVQIPGEGPDLIETKPVVEPAYDDLATELFTIAGDDASYVATKTTFLLDEEKPYDLMWWNDGSGAWEWINGYGSSWAPAYGSIEDFALTISKNGKAELENAEGGASTTFTIVDNKIVFADEITLLTAGDVSIKGKEFTVMKCSADDNEVVFGIPVEYNASGVANKYLCAKMTIKPISGGQSGPLVLKVDNSKLDVYTEADKYLRIQFYNPWAGKADSEWPVDPTALKLKKNQKLVLKFTVSGIDWTATPRAAFCCNIDGFAWEPDCFTNFQGQDFNTTGETVMTLTNETGSTYNFYETGSLQVSIQLDGFASSLDISNAVVNVTSLTIE